MGDGVACCRCGVVAITDSRPCVFRPPSLAAGHFLLLAQKKVTKENGTLASAVAGASMPARLREQAPGSAHGTSLCRDRTRAHPARARAARGYFLHLLAAAEREPGKSRARQSLPQKHRIYATPVYGHVVSFALLFGFPLSSGGGRTDQPRAPHAGGARDRADSDNRPWMACGPNPSARSEPLAPRAARIRGCRFLWLLSFGQAKESNWRPWMADITHTDVNRLSRQHRT